MKKAKINKWIKCSEEVKKLDERFGHDIFYRTVIISLILGLLREGRRIDVPEYISDLVNEELINFDSCIRERSGKIPEHWKP